MFLNKTGDICFGETFHGAYSRYSEWLVIKRGNVVMRAHNDHTCSKRNVKS